LQGRLEDAGEEVDGGNRPLTALPASDELRVEGEDDRREIGRRVAVSDRAADRPPVPYLRIADLAGGERHDRALLLQERRPGDVRMPGQCTDRDAIPVLADVRQLADPPDVDEKRRPGDAELHRGQ
jgi:hypothetical protein